MFTVIAILAYVVLRGVPGMSWEFLTAMPKNRAIEGGILPALLGSLWLLVGTCAFTLPLGIMAAVYLSEYSRKGPGVGLINLALVNLAGVPSIVYGLFGLAFFVLLLRFGPSLLSACLTLSLMSLPVVVTAAREALLAVPQTHREAALALGAGKWQTIHTVVLPQAKRGIITGTVLAMGRAVGETAPILATGVAFVLPRLPEGLMSRFMALPYHLYVSATQIPEMPKERVWATVLALLFLAVLFNASAFVVRRGIGRGEARNG
jgi:phosphate transport system permease protein